MKSFACPKCDAKYEGEPELVLHFRVNHSNTKGRLAIPVKCKLCQSLFPSKKDYVIHFRTHSEKKHGSSSSEESCLSNVSLCSKNKKDKKPRRSVWDDCKKVLTEKSGQVSSANANFVVPKLPRSKQVVFQNTSPDEIKFNYFKTSSDKMKAVNFTSLLKENKMANYSNQSGIDCDSNSAQRLLGESQNLDNQVHFKTEPMDVTETENLPFSCNICGSSFKDTEKYEAHYSTHLDKELCQIREGDEELRVCNTCGRCFTELNTFHAHILTHVKKELV